MTGKLIKFEFKSIIKQIGAIWAAVPVVAVFCCIIDYVFNNTDFARNNMHTIGSILQAVSGILYVSVFVVLIAVTILIILQRFYKGLLKDEGYLMHTLPVKPWQLITSKGVVAFVVTVVSGIVAFLSIMILVGIGTLPEIFSSLADAIRALNQEPEYYLYVFEVILLIVLSIFKSIYQLYASMSIGQLSNSHKILFSVLAYMGISFILTTLLVIIITVLDSALSYDIMNLINNIEIFWGGQLIIIAFIVVTAVQLVAFHIISERLLSRKLNLE